MKRPGIDETHNRKLQCESEMLLYSSLNEKDRSFCDLVLSTMRMDDVSFVIKRDKCIVNYVIYCTKIEDTRTTSDRNSKADWPY